MTYAQALCQMWKAPVFCQHISKMFIIGHFYLYENEHFVYGFEQRPKRVGQGYMSEKQGKILIVDDDEDILVAGKLLLKRHYASVETCNNPECIPGLLAQESYDAILLDMNFGPGESSGAQGFVWLKRILEIDPQAVVVMITAHGGVGVAVEAMKQGATDFVAKPWQNERWSPPCRPASSSGKADQKPTRSRKPTGRWRRPPLNPSSQFWATASPCARCFP